MLYVIMDMEWIDCCGDIPCPTQIAAVRVNESWEKLEAFSRLIRPVGKSCRDWQHMAYSGAEKKDFLAADDIKTVFQALQEWLREEDILLWWAADPARTFADTILHFLGRNIRERIRLLQHAAAGVCGKSGNAYKLAESRGVHTGMQPHVSANDVEIIRLLMADLQLDAASIKDTLKEQSPRSGNNTARYYYDPLRKLVHTAQDGCVKDGVYVRGYESIKNCIRKKMKPCPVCCSAIYRRESAALSEDVISRTNYNYIYRPESEVFHTAECFYAKRIPYWNIRGSVHMDTCLKAGKRPCRICRPSAEYVRPAEMFPATVETLQKDSYKHAPPIPGMTRALRKAEQRAWDRYIQSEHEREAQDYSSDDQDSITRTSASFAFWSARGYSNFHIKGCPKLKGLSNLRGFARYRDAVHKGLAPCRRCRPSSKHDLSLTVFKGGKSREGETAELLDALCDAQGYAHKQCESYYYISTPVGEWRLHMEDRPVDLWHINLVNCRGARDKYHRQPKLLLSLKDTFEYIHGHDKALLKK